MNNIENCNRVYIIGDNGSGKSRWLANHAEVKSKSNHVVVISSVVSDKFKFGSKVKKKANGSLLIWGTEQLEMHHI